MGVSQPRMLNWAGPATCNRAAPNSNAPLINDNTSNCQGVGAAAPVRGARNSAARSPSRIQPHSERRSVAEIALMADDVGRSCGDRLKGTSISVWASSGPHWLGNVSAQVLLLAFRSFMRASCHRGVAPSVAAESVEARTQEASGTGQKTMESDA